jgi:hypothetical protein
MACKGKALALAYTALIAGLNYIPARILRSPVLQQRARQLLFNILQQSSHYSLTYHISNWFLNISSTQITRENIKQMKMLSGLLTSSTHISLRYC